MPEKKELKERRAGEKELKALEDLRKDMDAALAELRELAMKTATKRPLLELGVAFVVGMAFGIALSRPRD